MINLINNILGIIIIGGFAAFLVFLNMIKDEYYKEHRTINERNKKK